MRKVRIRGGTGLNKIALLSHGKSADAKDGSQPPDDVYRYFAYLSYSHQDSADADWLHKAIERFATPTALVGRITPNGVVPKHLTPIFRDRNELAASSDLGQTIRGALKQSRYLIVLCSPTAARSRWVNEEILAFKKLRGERYLLAAIIDGEPWASDIEGREAEECFPPALREKFDRKGRPTSKRAEPIAADLRADRDGREAGKLKLIAGMLGLGLDDLVRREQQRRQKRLTYIAAAAIAGMALTSGLAVFAFEKRDEARDQRRQAEGLVGFMIGDLRTKLEPIGRLDVLDVVGEKALDYYRKQDKMSLSDDSLAQRAKALTMIGEIAAKRGQRDGALQRYQEALAGTAEALRRAPDDPQRMFDHAQSVYWVGSVALDRGRIDDAAAQFIEYRDLATRMIATDPANPKWQLEGIYAATNLGNVEIQQRRYARAAVTFGAALRSLNAMVAVAPGNSDYRKLRLESLAFLSDALDRSGMIDAAINARDRQLALLGPELANGRADEEYRRKAMIANMAVARLRFQHGDTALALAHAKAARALGERLTAIDPSNAEWRASSAMTRINQALLLIRTGKATDARQAIGPSCATIEQLVRSDPTIALWEQSEQRCLALRAELAIAVGDKAAALPLARALVARVANQAAQPNSDPFRPAESRKLVGDIAWRSGDRAGAQVEWRAALAAWPKAAETPIQFGERGEMLRGIGDRAGGRAIAQRLLAMGYRQSISNRARV